jgi:hypothetical protein
LFRWLFAFLDAAPHTRKLRRFAAMSLERVFFQPVGLAQAGSGLVAVSFRTETE